MSNPRAHRTHRPPDSFRIVSGALGPVPKCELSIKPMTVFIGRQGTGKSLVAQALFALEELPFLMALVGGRRGGSRLTAQALFGEVLDQLRSSSRRFATFANKRVHIQWRRGTGFEGFGKMPEALEFRAYRNNRQVVVGKATTKYLEGLRAKKPTHNAVFFPTERMMMSQLHTAVSQQVLSLPITFTLFAQWLDQYAVVEAAGWSKNRPPTAEGQLVDELSAAALGGSARRLGEQWKWVLGNGGQPKLTFDLDMASSGQRANWSIGYIGRTLFSLRGKGDVADELTLYIEEPEIHLHPSAQRELIKMCALFVNSGLRVVLTTHSLSVLYTLNNLLQAGLLGAEESPDVPAPPFRLAAKDVSVYAFTQDKAPRQLVDEKRAFIDERELGSIGDELSSELNRIASLLPIES